MRTKIKWFAIYLRAFPLDIYGKHIGEENLLVCIDTISGNASTLPVEKVFLILFLAWKVKPQYTHTSLYTYNKDSFLKSHTKYQSRVESDEYSYSKLNKPNVFLIRCSMQVRLHSEIHMFI